MTDPRWVFWNMSAQDLIFAAGQFLLLAAAVMLAAKHVVWFWRRRARRERRSFRVMRAWVELVVSTAIAVLYAGQIYLVGATERLDDVGSAVQVWCMAILFMALVVGRLEEGPPR